MPNPYHFRARIDRLWQTANSNRPGYIRLNALDAVARALYRPTDKARQNLKLYLATDPYEVAQHKLRHLHDQPSLLPPRPLGEACPALDAGGRGEGSPTLPSPPAAGGGRCLVEACPALDAGTEGGLPHDDASPPNEDDDPL